MAASEGRGHRDSNPEPAAYQACSSARIRRAHEPARGDKFGKTVGTATRAAGGITPRLAGTFPAPHLRCSPPRIHPGKVCGDKVGERFPDARAPGVGFEPTNKGFQPSFFAMYSRLHSPRSKNRSNGGRQEKPRDDFSVPKTNVVTNAFGPAREWAGSGEQFEEGRGVSSLATAHRSPLTARRRGGLPRSRRPSDPGGGGRRRSPRPRRRPGRRSRRR